MESGHSAKTSQCWQTCSLISPALLAPPEDWVVSVKAVATLKDPQRKSVSDSHALHRLIRRSESSADVCGALKASVKSLLLIHLKAAFFPHILHRRMTNRFVLNVCHMQSPELGLLRHKDSCLQSCNPEVTGLGPHERVQDTPCSGQLLPQAWAQVMGTREGEGTQTWAVITLSRTQPLSGQDRFCQRSRVGEKAGSGHHRDE